MPGTRTIGNLRYAAWMLCLWTALILGSVSSAWPADHGDAILQRSHALALADQDEAMVTEARAWVAGLPGDGWWSQVPQSQPGKAGWQPAEHMRRLLVLAVLSGPGGPLANDSATTAALTRGIDAWHRLRPRSDNWWHNEIGVPQMAAQILASRRDLDASRQQALLAWIGKPLDEGLTSTFTGQNLAWRAGVALLAAAARGDHAGITRAIAVLTSTLAVTDGEGLQADGSWHQHGAQFMTGSYGRTWVADLGRLRITLAGTPWAFTPAQAAIHDLAALDGLAWTLRGGVVDPAALGRTLSRANAHGSRHLRRLADAMAGLDGPRAAEWRAVAESCQPGRSACAGAKHFWRAEASFLHRPGFSVGVLAATTRTLRVESINEEHLRGALHADGAVWIRRRGDEFATMTPGLPWGLLPGTVAAIGTKLGPKGLTIPAESAYGAGIAEGRLLVHGWDLARGKLSGQQAWFGTSQGLIALVCGVRHPDAEVRMAGPLLPLRGPVLRGGSPLGPDAPLAAGEALLHDGLAWLALEGEWRIDQPVLRGTWRSINAAQADGEVAVPALRMRRDLGRAPSDGSGAWALLEADDGRIPTLHARILANTPAVQAVADDDGSVLAAFRAAGSIGGLAVDGPAVVLARPDGRVLAADPSAPSRSRSLRVQWNGRTGTVQLPGGAQGACPVLVISSP